MQRIALIKSMQNLASSDQQVKIPGNRDFLYLFCRCEKDKEFKIQRPVRLPAELVRLLTELVRLLADSRTCPPAGGFRNLLDYQRNLSGGLSPEGA